MCDSIVCLPEQGNVALSGSAVHAEANSPFTVDAASLIGWQLGGGAGTAGGSGSPVSLLSGDGACPHEPLYHAGCSASGTRLYGVAPVDGEPTADGCAHDAQFAQPCGPIQPAQPPPVVPPPPGLPPSPERPPPTPPTPPPPHPPPTGFVATVTTALPAPALGNGAFAAAEGGGGTLTAASPALVAFATAASAWAHSRAAELLEAVAVRCTVFCEVFEGANVTVTFDTDSYPLESASLEADLQSDVRTALCGSPPHASSSSCVVHLLRVRAGGAGRRLEQAKPEPSPFVHAAVDADADAGGRRRLSGSTAEVDVALERTLDVSESGAPAMALASTGLDLPSGLSVTASAIVTLEATTTLTTAAEATTTDDQAIAISAALGDMGTLTQPLRALLALTLTTA